MRERVIDGRSQGLVPPIPTHTDVPCIECTLSRVAAARSGPEWNSVKTMGTETLAARGPEHGHEGRGTGPASNGHGQHDCETRAPHGNGQGNAGAGRGHSSHESADDCAPSQFGGNEPGIDAPPPDISFDFPSTINESLVTRGDQPETTQVPEPTSLVLFGGGLMAGVRAYRRRRCEIR